MASTTQEKEKATKKGKPKYTDEEKAVILYFASLNLTGDPIAVLLAHKCGSKYDGLQIGGKVAKIKKGFGGHRHLEWDYKLVGQFLAKLEPNGVNFERLISFGVAEKDLVLKNINPRQNWKVRNAMDEILRGAKCLDISIAYYDRPGGKLTANDEERRAKITLKKH